MSFWKWSRTASANATADGSINWAEGMAPSAVNDSARAMMAAAAKFRDDVSGTLATGGTATAYAVTTNQAFDTLAHLDKAILTIVPHATSGASPTLNVDGLGAKAVNVSTGVAVPTGALVQGTPYEVVYFNATAEFIVTNGTPVLVTSASNLSANVVTTAKILDANVTYAKIQNVAHGKVLARLSASAGVVEEAVIPFGQCRLAKSGSNLVLSPFKGNLITINSLAETIPDAGVTLSTGGLSPTALYYIYAWMNSGTMTLEASTTAYATQVGTGVTVKAGDATRTLVGMARTDGSTAWTDSATQRFVRSWFNDPGISLLNGFTANRSISSASWTEVNSEIRIELVAWSGEVVQVEANGVTLNNTVNAGATTSIGFDGATADDTSAYGGLVTAGGFPGNIYAPFAASVFKSGLSEGYHYATLLGATLSGGGATWFGAASNATPTSPRCTLRGFLKL
jgi:hypothetical protein